MRFKKLATVCQLRVRRKNLIQDVFFKKKNILEQNKNTD